MNYREVVCSQHEHCLSCPLLIVGANRDCRDLSDSEIRAICKAYDELVAKSSDSEDWNR